MNIEFFVTIIAVLASTISVTTSMVAFRSYKKDIHRFKLRETEHNKFVEIDEELISYIHRIKRDERKAPLSVVVTDSELSILSKFEKNAA